MSTTQYGILLITLLTFIVVVVSYHCVLTLLYFKDRPRLQELLYLDFLSLYRPSPQAIVV